MIQGGSCSTRDCGLLNNVLLKNMFRDNLGCLNVCHINTQSINMPSKLDEIRQTFINSDVHLIAVSESWLKSNVTNSSVSIDGYKLYRNDRPRKRGGGVCFYVSNRIRVSKIVSLSSSSRFEHLFIELLIAGCKVLCGVVYNPDRSNDVDEFEIALSTVVPLYDDVIIMGDFNYDLLSSDPTLKKNQMN